MRRRAWVPAACALGLLAAGLAVDRGTPPPHRPWARLTDLAASVEWIRAETALAAGREDVALLRAERAANLAPTDPSSWQRLVGLCLLGFASAEREPSGERRAAWVRLGLAHAERGVLRAREPGSVALVAATALRVQSEVAGPPTWPGGVEALRELAATWYRRALELGDERAADGLTALR